MALVVDGGRWTVDGDDSVEVEPSKFGRVCLVEVLGGKLPQATMSQLFVGLTSTLYEEIYSCLVRSMAR